MAREDTGAGPGGPSLGPGGGGADLASSPAQKKAAVKAIQEHIEPDTRKAGNFAEGETGAAVKAFDAKDGHGWLTSAALKKAHKSWESQVQVLMNRLGSEKTALRSANVLLQGSDILAGGQLRPPSPLDRF